MFQWQITLSDKQVIMLAAFHASEPDEYGQQFGAVHQMIGDAWDCRAVRKLEEMNLISVNDWKHPQTGLQSKLWAITEKGKLIAKAIMFDADSLKQINLRRGLDAVQAINSSGLDKWKERQRLSAEKQREQKKEELAKVKIPAGWVRVDDNDKVRLGDKRWDALAKDWRVITRVSKKPYQYLILIRESR